MYSDFEIEHIRELLTSPDLANVKIGIEMIKNSRELIRNFPKELVIFWHFIRDREMALSVQNCLYIGFSKEEIEAEMQPLLILTIDARHDEEQAKEWFRLFRKKEPEYRAIFLLFPGFYDSLIFAAKELVRMLNLHVMADYFYQLNVDYYPNMGISNYSQGSFLQMYRKELANLRSPEKHSELIVERLRKSIECHYQPAKSYFYLGWEYQYGIQNNHKAKEAYLEVVKLDPSQYAAVQNLGVLNDLEENYEEAKKWYRQVLQLKPDESHSLNNLAWILAREPDGFEEARSLIERAIEINPSQPYYRATYAYILWKGFKETERAEELYQHSFKKAPSVDSASCIGEIQRDYYKDYKLAKAWFEHALSIDANSLHALGLIANLCWDHLDKNDCIEYYEKMLELNPSYPGIQTRLDELKKG